MTNPEGLGGITSKNKRAAFDGGCAGSGPPEKNSAGKSALAKADDSVNGLSGVLPSAVRAACSRWDSALVKIARAAVASKTGTAVLPDGGIKCGIYNLQLCSCRIALPTCQPAVLARTVRRCAGNNAMQRSGGKLPGCACKKYPANTHSHQDLATHRRFAGSTQHRHSEVSHCSNVLERRLAMCSVASTSDHHA